MFMDDTNSPVSFSRLFKLIQERTKKTETVLNENLMLPKEIEVRLIEAKKFGNNVSHFTKVSENFLNAFENFVVKNLVDEISRVRESFGLHNSPN